MIAVIVTGIQLAEQNMRRPSRLFFVQEIGISREEDYSTVNELNPPSSQPLQATTGVIIIAHPIGQS